MRLSNPDLTLLRDSQNHYTDLYLSIFQPSTIFSARVNDASIAKGEREITYDNASGNWQNVKIGSTLLVGSSAGARDKGKIRIKDITSSVITVAENNYIEWGNNQYLTVLNYFDVWPIFPLIVQDPADSEQVIFYKDYDIPYTNQNTVLGAFLNIGPHRAEFIENGSADVYYSASGTYPLSGAISDVQWTFQSGTPSSYNGLNPGYVSYGTPGHYLTQCTVSGTNGWVEIGYRYVSIYDKPDEGTNNPIKLWSVSDVQGSRAEAGYTFSVSVFEPVVVQEGSVIVLFADEWYDGTRKSLGGNALNASKIKFVGYVMDNSIRYDYKDSSVTFDVGSITQIMKEMEGFAIEIKSVANPSTWTEMANINAKKATYHYWKWHSNVISLADIEFVGDDFLVQYFDSDRESLFDSVDNFLRSAYHASAVSDKQGKIWLETDAWARPNATGTYSSILNLSKYDWIGEPTIREQRYPELSYLEYNGIAYSGVSTGTYVPLMANAPGDAPAYRGKSERRTGLALLGQSQLNQLVGDEFTHRNTQFPAIDFRMRGNWSNLDIAPQEALQVDISASDTVRNVGISGLYMPSSITWNFDSDAKTFIPRCTFSAITSGEPGETIVIPEIVDDGGYGGRPGGGVFPLVTPSVPSFFSVNPFIQASFSDSGILNISQDFGLSVDINTYFSTGTYSGVTGSVNRVIVPYYGYYEVSFFMNTEIIDPFSNYAEIYPRVNGVSSEYIPHIKCYYDRIDGSGLYRIDESSGYSIIGLFNAGDSFDVYIEYSNSDTEADFSINGTLLLKGITG